MLTREWVITIPGRAATKGSMKCIGRVGKRAHVLIEDHKRSDPWRKTVAGWLKKSAGDVSAEKHQPLGAEITFTIDRPKAHYRTHRNRDTGVVESTGVLKPAAPVWPVGHNTGDVDKLLRLVLDAMQDADLIPDDCAVVEVTARKGYPAEPGDLSDLLPWPGVRIRLYPMDGDTP